MFLGASSFNGDVSTWNTEEVTKITVRIFNVHDLETNVICYK